MFHREKIQQTINVLNRRQINLVQDTIGELKLSGSSIEKQYVNSQLDLVCAAIEICEY